MADWRDALAEVSELAPSETLRQRVIRAANVQQRPTVSTAKRNVRRLRRGGVWLLGATGVAAVLAALALAAHTRSTSSGPTKPPASLPKPSTVSSAGVSLRLPAGWAQIKPATGDPVSDPKAVLVVGTHGVRMTSSHCLLVGDYRIPADGAAVIILRWSSSHAGGGPVSAGRHALAKLTAVKRPMFECYSGPGAAVQLHAGGADYEVAVLVGRHASAAVTNQALAVGRSFTVAYADVVVRVVQRNPPFRSLAIHVVCDGHSSPAWPELCSAIERAPARYTNARNRQGCWGPLAVVHVSVRGTVGGRAVHLRQSGVCGPSAALAWYRLLSNDPRVPSWLGTVGSAVPGG
jgi:hypothetical protein